MNDIKQLLKVYEQVDQVTNNLINLLADESIPIIECRSKVSALTKEIDYLFAKAYNLNIDQEEKSYLEYAHEKIQLMIRIAPHISDNGEK